jgi:hypothetical protein
MNNETISSIGVGGVNPTAGVGAGAGAGEKKEGKVSKLDKTDKFGYEKLIKELHQKINNIKKSSEVDMANAKKIATEKAKLMLEETVKRINKQFQNEVSNIVADFRGLKQDLATKEREIKALKQFIGE